MTLLDHLPNGINQSQQISFLRTGMEFTTHEQATNPVFQCQVPSGGHHQPRLSRLKGRALTTCNKATIHYTFPELFRAIQHKAHIWIFYQLSLEML
jgi:hypothetical protein